MNDLRSRLSRLSPKQRTLLERRLGNLLDDGGRERIAPYQGSATTFPLSFSQRRLWFVDQLEGESSAYNICYAIRLRGLLDETRLHRALTAAVARHEALRTVFAEGAEGPVQRIEPSRPIPCPVVDLRALPRERREARAGEVLSRQARRSFALVRWPLMDCTLLRLDEGEHVLGIIIHHIVADAWSVMILIRDLTLCYLTPGGRLPELPIQYKDFALWQLGWLRGETLDRQLSFWRRELSGVPAFLDLPVDRSRPALQSFRGAKLPFTFPQEVAERLGELCRGEESVTLFIVLLALFQCLLWCATGQEDFVISSPISYRHLAECEGLVGFFANTLLFRTNLDGDPRFLELLARVKARVFAAYSHQDTPLDLVVQEIAPDRVSSYTPLLQVSLNFIHSDLGGITAGNDLAAAAEGALAVEEFDFEYGNAATEIGLVVTSERRRLGGTLHYKADLFEPSTIRALIDRFQFLVGLVGGAPHLRLGEIRAELAAWDERRRTDARQTLKLASVRRFQNKQRSGYALTDHARKGNGG